MSSTRIVDFQRPIVSNRALARRAEQEREVDERGSVTRTVAAVPFGPRASVGDHLAYCPLGSESAATQRRPERA